MCLASIIIPIYNTMHLPTMAVVEKRPDWSNLPTDLLKPIGKRTRDAVTGLAAFRSVCRAWRAALGPAPRLMLPRAGPSEDALVFPLSHGWCIVVDARDASCRLSHLATGATAALPRLHAVRHAGSDIQAEVPTSQILGRNYLQFTDFFRFAAHVPLGAPPTIMMSHMLLGPWGTGFSFCRPGDAAWTSVNKLFPIYHGYVDLAYHDGKMFGLDSGGQMTVFDAATLHALCIVERPPETPNLANKMYSWCTDKEEFNFVHLVALPSKLVLVRTRVKSSRPVAFDVFQLGPTPDGLAWLKVRDAGNYQLFLDGYHTAFSENNDGGTRIYYVHDIATAGFIHEERRIAPAAYCYSMQDNKLECVYMPPEDIHQCSTKPSWFVP
ncbi:hypothetical protein BDA96_01G056300 [Sorghum bicolor]|jgi:hypothetical protein|uniref:KIB1-4 beta-propeller domain-containing protein n=2 Tax=Sorghum bicolor TaxID=4558 RepID=A0A921UXB7_SORBI|nr:hypothetical protein SORBI_3001G055300 [Sorghum bicolor]KAG0547168.1 hypothetical protein BDA96_01G056300 [Sorghum bicolor]